MILAVLLTCHNRKEKTLKCLENLYSQSNIENIAIEVFLVDDGSTDGTGEAVKIRYPNVRVIKGTGELYWNRGMLLAWETALSISNCNCCVWLNDDTMLLPHAISCLVDCLTRHPNSIIVGSTCDSFGVLSYGGYLQKNVLLKPEKHEERCVWFNGNIVLIPRTVSDKIGLLDKRFSHAMGDFEYGRRATKNNITCYATPVIGHCNRNGDYVKWMDKKYSVINRLKILYSPLGNNPFESFYLIQKDSLFRACIVFFYLHLKAVIPSLFPNRNSF